MLPKLNIRLIIFIICTAIYHPSISQIISDNEIAVVLKKMEREANRQLPLGSQLSMVISVQAGPGRMFTYRSVQTTQSYEWTTSMKQHSRRIAINDYCTNPELSWFKEQQVTVSWIISDIDGRHVTTNAISNTMCR